MAKKAAMGALVRYCGHKATFIADIWVLGTVNIVHAAQPIDLTFPVGLSGLDRSDQAFDAATHHLKDFPAAGFWKPYLGIFVVPEKQVVAIPLRRRRR